MRWERHWWQKTEPVEVLKKGEPTIWVDPELYVDDEPTELRRVAQGTIPPPVCVGPYSELEEITVVTGELVVLPL